jgi:hypothetical protein
MHKFFTSSFDASIYLQQPEQNAGRDEILEVGKLYYGSTMDIARTLIKFNTTQVSQSIVENIGTGSYSVFLNLKSANSEEIPLEYTLYANAISGSWKMGTGTKFDNITSDGVSWYYLNGSSKWQDISGSYPAQTDTSSILNGGGGLWYSASMASQSFSNEPDDIRMDVTNIVKLWISGSNRLPNDGIILHHHTSVSLYTDTTDYGVLKFFSKETNTIYEPKLELVWDDSSFITGSLSAITGSKYSDALDNTKIIVTNLKNEYVQNTKTKIRVKGRELFPSKTFGNTIAYDTGSFYLPTSSYYQIEDYVTNETIIPFGNYSKLSCDSKSNYFYLDTNTYPIERVYRLKIKVESDGITKVVDEKLTFKIV